jgi:5'-deoxynucleotidase YfbR-like HD superfamily hydrolase
MRKTLEFILNGSEVKRFHTLITHQLETVGHHSHGVACLTLMLDPDASRQLIIAALFHDLAEQHTGDIPSPAKREYGIGDQVDRLERRLMSDAGLTYPSLNAYETRTLKLADIAHGALFCLREVRLGNRRMLEVYDRYVAYASEFILIGSELELFNTIRGMRYES